MANKKISELVAATLPLVGDESFELVQGGVNKKVPLSSLARIILTADTTYYVATTGNDSTGDGSVGNPWLTVQKAIDYVGGSVDIGAWDVTIQVADGTYGAGFVVTGPWIGSGDVTVLGNASTPANVLINAGAGDCIVCQSGGRLYLNGLKLTNTGTFGLLSTGASYVGFQNIDFGACGNQQLRADFSAVAQALGNYTVSGNAQIHIISIAGIVRVQNQTVTVTGTPAFSTFFASCQRLGLLLVNGNTYSGSATGARYAANLNSVIDTSGGGANYFPGNAAGSVSTGAQYA